MKKIISLVVVLALASSTLAGLSVIFASAAMTKPEAGGESSNILVWDMTDWEAYSDEAYRATKNKDDSITFGATEDNVIWNGLAGKDGIETSYETLEAGTYYAKLLFKTSNSDDETIVKADDKDAAASVQLLDGKTYDFGIVDAEFDGKWQSVVIPFEVSDVSDAEMIFKNNWVGEEFKFTVGQYLVISTSDEALAIEYDDDAPKIDIGGETPTLGWGDTTFVAPGYTSVAGLPPETAYAFDLPALYSPSSHTRVNKITASNDPNVGLLETKANIKAGDPILDNLPLTLGAGNRIQRGTYYLKFIFMGNEIDTVHNRPDLSPPETGNKSNEILQVRFQYTLGDTATACDTAVGTADVDLSGEWQSVVVPLNIDHDFTSGRLDIAIKNGGTGSKHTVTLPKYVLISADPKELVREDFEGNVHVGEEGKFSSQPESLAEPSIPANLPDKNKPFTYEYGQDTNWGALGAATAIDDNDTKQPTASELAGLTSEAQQALRRERRIDDVIVATANDTQFTNNMITYSGVTSGKKYLKFVIAFDNLWNNPYSANAVTGLYEMAYFRNALDNKSGRFGNLTQEAEGKWQSIVMEIDFEADSPAGMATANAEMNRAVTFWLTSLHGQGATTRINPDTGLSETIPDDERFHIYLLNHVVLSDDKTPLPVPQGKRDVYRRRGFSNEAYLGSIEGEVKDVLPPAPDLSGLEPDPIVYEDKTKENNSYTVSGRTPTISGLHAAELLNEIELGFAQQLAYGQWPTFNIASMVYMGLVNNADDRELTSDGVVTVSVPIPSHALPYAKKIRVMTYKYGYDYTATFPHLFKDSEGSLYYGDHMVLENNANIIIPELSADGKNLIFKTHEAMTTEGLNYALVVDDANYRRPGSGANTGVQNTAVFIAIGIVIIAIGGAVTLVLLKKKTTKED